MEWIKGKFDICLIDAINNDLLNSQICFSHSMIKLRINVIYFLTLIPIHCSNDILIYNKYVIFYSNITTIATSVGNTIRTSMLP